MNNLPPKNLIKPPTTIESLQTRLKTLAGLSLAELYSSLSIAEVKWQEKGTFGQAIELFLGADAKNEAVPDFKDLGIELKSLPINASGQPKESTFVASINLQRLANETWESSAVCRKLSHVLWLPFESDPTIAYPLRRIGMGFFWKPTESEQECLKHDWQELSDLIVLGRLNEISAKLGRVLQVRPKGANAKSLCNFQDKQGRVIKTLPRGFYLRRSFTSNIMKRMQ